MEWCQALESENLAGNSFPKSCDSFFFFFLALWFIILAGPPSEVLKPIKQEWMVSVNKPTWENSDLACLNISVNPPCLYWFSFFWLELSFCYNSFLYKKISFSSYRDLSLQRLWFIVLYWNSIIWIHFLSEYWQKYDINCVIFNQKLLSFVDSMGN